MIEILKIYKHRRYNEIIKAKKATIKDAVAADSYTKFIHKCNADYIDMIKANGQYEYIKANGVTNDIMLIPAIEMLNEETVEKINEAEKKADGELKARDRMLAEVEAQLDIVDGNDQVIAVLKRYGILNEEGKLAIN